MHVDGIKRLRDFHDMDFAVVRMHLEREVVGVRQREGDKPGVCRRCKAR
jgi:hypothetical protein